MRDWDGKQSAGAGGFLGSSPGWPTRTATAIRGSSKTASARSLRESNLGSSCEALCAHTRFAFAHTNRIRENGVPHASFCYRRTAPRATSQTLALAIDVCNRVLQIRVLKSNLRRSSNSRFCACRCSRRWNTVTAAATCVAGPATNRSGGPGPCRRPSGRVVAGSPSAQPPPSPPTCWPGRASSSGTTTRTGASAGGATARAKSRSSTP